MVRTVCSWDVGIKNLAYCIFQYDNGNINIIKWDIINFAQNKSVNCCAKKRSGSLCTNKAKYVGTNSENIVLNYCGTHKKLYKPFSYDIETYFKPANKSTKCNYILPKKKICCTSNAKFTDNNKYYCTSHMKITKKHLIKDAQIKPIKTEKCTSADMQILAKNLYRSLNNTHELGNIDVVYIENQPTHTNPTMKTISSLLFGYFVLKNIDTVRFISPSNKLKVDKELQDDLFNLIDKDHKIYKIIKKIIEKNNSVYKEESKEDILKNIIYQQKKSDKIYKISNKNYDITKELGIIYTKLLLKDNKKQIDHLMSYKKKDDLCDALLQGYFKEKSDNSS